MKEETFPTALPPPRDGQNYVTISPFAAGHITLPEYIFYAPSDPVSKVLVPSMSFLIQHPKASLFGQNQGKQFRMLFDLGVRAEPSRYVPVLQKHIKTRSPIQHRPSALDTLQANGYQADDIDAIAISHVHWDHHGDPEDFPNSTFLLGPGAKSVLANGLPGTGNHSVFDPNLYKDKTVVEFESLPGAEAKAHAHDGCCPPEQQSANGTNSHANGGSKAASSETSKWQQLGPFPHALDLFGDGSAYIISAPGHLPGHINMLCRTSPTKWIYLGGDTFHDRRMLTGEKWITTYPDESGNGRTCCIHIDKEAAQKSLDRVAELVRVAKTQEYTVEPVVAHDVVWWRENQEKMLPNTL